MRTQLFAPHQQPECVADTGSWCARVYDLTHTDVLARYADAAIGGALRILLIVAIAVVLRLVLHRAIGRLTAVTTDGLPAGPLRPLRERTAKAWRATLSPQAVERRVQRGRTIGSVLRSGTTLLVFGVAFVLVLGELGINLGPILASAGIVGIALGFGAQNLVKDFLSGVFMMLEDQYGVGDIVDLGEASGTVEAVGLRITTVRDIAGTVWYVRNGEVLRVGNKSQGYAVAVVDLLVGHGADLPEATALAQRTAVAATSADGPLAGDVLAQPEVLGVESVTAEGITLRLTVKVRAGQQWAVQRALLAAVKDAFADHDVPPPAPFGRPAP